MNSKLRQVFESLTWKTKENGRVDLRGAKAVYTEKDWKKAKRSLSHMKEETDTYWNHVFFGIYDGVEKLSIHHIKMD